MIQLNLKTIMWINLQRKRKRRIVYNEEEEKKCNRKTRRKEEDKEMRKVAVWAFKKKFGMKVLQQYVFMSNHVHSFNFISKRGYLIKSPYFKFNTGSIYIVYYRAVNYYPGS